MTALAESLIVYLALCVVGTTAGLTVLRATCPSLAAWPRLFLSPVMCLALWAVFLGAGVALGITVRSLVRPLGAVTLVLAGCGAWGLVRRLRSGVRADTSALATLSLAVILPIGALWPFFWHGLADYPGSVAPDGWSYVAYGQYLWEHRRFEDGGLAPLYQFASHLSITRHVSSSLLHLLAAWTRLFVHDVPAADAQVGVGLLLAWALYVFGTACAAIGALAGLRPIWLACYLVLAVVSGWTGNLVYAYNLDSGTALGLFPALLALVAVVPARSWSSAVPLGVLASAILYTQPEVAAPVLGAVAFAAVHRPIREPLSFRSWSATLGLALVVVLVLTAPYMSALIAFVRLQSYNALTVRVGGTLFDGLVQSQYYPAAFWGLGGEHRAASHFVVRNLLGAFFSAAALAGLWALVKQRQHALVFAAGLMLGGFCFLAVGQGYGYGAYKVLLLGWWIIALLPAVGLAYVSRRSEKRAVAVAAGVAVVAALSIAFHEGSRTTRAIGTQLHNSMRRVRVVREIAGIVGSRGVLLAVDDPWANQWAVHYLRDLRLSVATRRSYMAQPWVVPFMERAQPVPLKDIAYALTDDRFDGGLGGTPAWAAGPYRLWSLPADWAVIVDASGRQSADDPVEMDVLAARSGTLNVYGAGGGSLASVPVHGGRSRIALPAPNGQVRVRLDGPPG